MRLLGEIVVYVSGLAVAAVHCPALSSTAIVEPGKRWPVLLTTTLSATSRNAEVNDHGWVRLIEKEEVWESSSPSREKRRRNWSG
jgi:hypothetical protein